MILVHGVSNPKLIHERGIVPKITLMPKIATRHKPSTYDIDIFLMKVHKVTRKDQQLSPAQRISKNTPPNSSTYIV